MVKYVDFISPIDMHGKEIKNILVENLSALPAETNQAGRIVYVTGDNAGYYYCTGSAWTKITDEEARKALDQRLAAVEASVGIGEGATDNLKDKVKVLENEVFGVEAAEGVEANTALRTLIGNNTSKISGLKTKVDANTNSIASNTSGIGAINTKIGTENIGTSVSITSAIKALQDNDAIQNDEIDALQTAVGGAESGLVKDVADLQNTVGNSDKGLVKDVTALKGTVGDSTKGLVKDVADIQASYVNKSQIVQTVAGTSETNIPSDKAVAAYVKDKITGVYQFAGTVPTYGDLASKDKVNGAVYNVEAQFEYDGKKYNAGTNVVYDSKTGAWEPLTGILDTSGFQLKDNLVTVLTGGEANKYPSVSAVKTAVDLKANAADVYTKTAADDLLDDKVDKLTSSHPTEGESATASFTKVTVNYQGQVISGQAQITESDISGSIAHTKIKDFDSKVRDANRRIVENVTLSIDGTEVDHTLNVEYPHVSIYEGTSLVYAAVEYISATKIKIYGTTSTPVRVVISA